MQVISTEPSAWPRLPYLGLRRFEASDHLLYFGRQDDIEFSCERLSTSAVRVLVLHGLSGSGKSSFLRAGLIPRLKKHQQDYPDEGIVPLSVVLTAGAEIMPCIAREVYSFVVQGLGRQKWENEARTLESSYPDIDQFSRESAINVDILISFLSELSNKPRYSLLVAIDQIENLWWRQGKDQDDKNVEHFVRFVNAFAEERLNGKLVLTLRTELYGMFASKLPNSTNPTFIRGGVNRLCHHYLANPSYNELVNIVKGPSELADAPYAFQYMESLAETFVAELQALVEKEADGISILPLLQVVLTQLYCDVKGRAGNGSFTITFEDYRDVFRADEQLSSIGLLDNFLHWALGRAVSRSFSDRGCGQRDLFEQRIEATRWRAVLKGFSASDIGGPRLRLQKLPDIERLAIEHDCELNAGQMVPVLTQPDIGLLRCGEDSESYTLQHDLLCLTFDRRTGSPSPSFCEQSVSERQRRVAAAAKYGVHDLFGDDRPPHEKLRVAELWFWDHKLLAYAAKHGFFQRLGIDVELVPCDDNVTASELVAKLDAEPQTYSVYSFPRELMTVDEKCRSTDVVVLNLFTGFAVICNAAAALPRRQAEWDWDAFQSIVQALLDLYSAGARYEAEDELAKNFFEHILSIAKSHMNLPAVDAIDGLQRSVMQAAQPGVPIIEKAISDRSRPFVAIVTAPTWAAAKMVEKEMVTIIDHRDVIDLLDRAPDAARYRVPELRRKLLVHNVMNVQVPPKRPLDKQLEELLLRLASIGLFLADCVWAFDETVGDWIRDRWNEDVNLAVNHRKVSPEIFRSTFRRAYRYSQSSEHTDTYFGAEWPEDCTNTLEICHKLQMARIDYENQAAIVALFQVKNTRLSQNICDLIERAHRHAAICNFYDAKRLMDEAVNLLPPSARYD